MGLERVRPLPYAITVSLVFVKDLLFAADKWPRTGPPRLDRDVIKLPIVSIEAANVDFAQVLRPIFDAAWQAAGLDGSASYDVSGKRVK